MKKIIVLTLLWLSITTSCFAQGAMASSMDNGIKARTAQMFNLTPEQYNHHFEFTLPDDGRLEIDFLRLSDWGEKNQLQMVAEAAARQVKMLKDSFKNGYTTKLLEMNIPIDGKVIALNYGEQETGSHQLAYKEGTYYQLKTGFDTIRVVRNVGVRTKPLTDSGLVQVQYTFILKDINDIIELSGNPATMANLGTVIDGEVAKYRKKWNNQDGRAHQLNLTYDPTNEKMKGVETQDRTGILKYIDVYVGVGAMFYTNNSVSPYFEETIAYLIPSRVKKMQPFIGANITGFGYLYTNKQQTSPGYISYNLEFGYCKRGSSFMSQKSSMMLGVMKVNNPDLTNSYLFHLGFTLGFNSFLSGGFNIGSDYKKGSAKSVLGVNFKFNL
jgi:hypothetical protein